MTKSEQKMKWLVHNFKPKNKKFLWRLSRYERNQLIRDLSSVLYDHVFSCFV